MPLPRSTKDIDPRLQLIDLDRADCEDSLYTFLRSAWHIFDSAPWVDGWCIDAIAEHLQAVIDGEIKRLIINVPPRCSKSAMCSIALPAWTWAQQHKSHTSGPGVSFLYASFREDLSRRDSVNCRRVIESDWYQTRWGNRFKLSEDQNTKSRFTNDQGGFRMITSVESKGATGDGANCFVVGTKVSTPHGSVPIEKISVGDYVCSFDEQRGMVVTSRVVATNSRLANDLYSLRETSGRTVTCTEDHPIYSPGRGFVCAGEMGIGDRLLVSNGSEISNADIDSSAVRELREWSGSASVLGSQSSQTEINRCLLQQEMSQRASRSEELKDVQALQKKAGQQARSLLLGRMQKFCARIAHKAMDMLDVRKEMFSFLQPRLLFEEMCGWCALCTDARSKELELPWQRGLFEFLQIPTSGHSNSRQSFVRRMRNDGGDQQAFLSSETVLAGAPYRRESSEQLTGEFDNAMRALSSVAPSWEISHIASITRDGEATQRVYDIQVEGTNCFFAEGILVHNCIILDDINSANEVESELVIEGTLEWFDGTMGTRFNNQKLGALIEIQQRLGENDITGHILSKNKGEWVHLCLPMRYEANRSFVTQIGWKDPRTVDGELLWPERFGEPEVKALETWMGDWRAAGQLQQRPEPRGGGIIKRDWWQTWEREVYPPMDYKLGVLDTAYTLDNMNDPSGMIVWGIFDGSHAHDLVDKDGQRITTARVTRAISKDGKPEYIARTEMPSGPRAMCMYAWTDRYEFHELIKKTVKTARDWKIDLLLIENKAAGISVAQEIQRLYSNEYFGVQLFDPKSQDKFARLVSVQHLFQEGLIYAPDTTWADGVITQNAQFPRGKHDEYVDLTSMGLRRLRDAGLLKRIPEAEAEYNSQIIYPRGDDMPLYPA